MRQRGIFRALLVVILGVTLVAPTALAADPITGKNKVHGGLYSDKWEIADDMNGMASWAGKRVSFVGSFHQPMESESPNWFGNTDHLLEEAWKAQATPFANLSINASAYAIAAGQKDGDIRKWATKVQGWLNRGGGRSLLIAPLQEMNGDWVPYGMDPGNFKGAYRRIRQIFRDMGMDETKVRWVFAPNGWSTPPYKIRDYYPGDDVVDVIGISAYNFGSCIDRWSTVYQTMGGAIEELRTTVSASKPYMIAQTGSSSCGGDKDAWLRELFRFTAADQNVVGLVYFNIHKETDWPVWDSSPSQGWKDGLNFSTTTYQWPLTNWFQPGPLPFQAYTPPFWDDDGSPHEPDIIAIYNAGITAGCSADRYCIDSPVTRAQMAVFLLRAMGHADHLPPYRGYFSDVPAEAWYTPWVEHLAEHGITSGCGGGRFCPDASVTRAQMAVFILTALNHHTHLPSYQGYFTDVPPGQYYTAYVEHLREHRITAGCSSTAYCPASPVSRGQMATFMARAFLGG